MKSCPVCDADYPDQHTTCPTDGAVLIVSQELAPGSLVRGKYRIVRKLGQGGMGIVYLADDTLLGVRVALKFLAGDLGKDPKFIKRFRMEARAAYQLRHPNIVEVTNLDQAEDGSLFIAMEFVEGPSLRTVLERAGALDISRALEIARDIASGLGAAHAQGTVHRDIKPENILLTRAADGREKPKILDFGIAAVAESVTRLSMTRGFLLTPDYAAPEQWLEMPADEMDGRTDLYALGCVLYEMLTGSKPFHAQNTSGLMKQHLEERPKPPSVLRPELANWQGLDAITLRLLAKDRDQRPKDALELLSLLDAVRYVPVEEGRETILQDTRKKRTETLVETAAVRPKPVTEQTQAPPAPTIAISEHSSARPPSKPSSELDPGSRGFPRWTWAALAVLVLTASVAAWRFLAPQPPPPTPPPVKQSDAQTAPAPQLSNEPQSPRKAGATTPPPAQLVVTCDKPCTWAVDGTSQGSLLPGSRGEAALTAQRHVVTAKPDHPTIMELATGAGKEQSRSLAAIPGRSIREDFVFASVQQQHPPPQKHPEIDALIESGYRKLLDDDLPGAYNAYSNAERLSMGSDKYRLQDALRGKQNVLADCRDRGISCFAKP